MKNYFENEKGIIIPFDKVIQVCTFDTNISVIVSDNQWNFFTLEQLDDYKQWLERQEKPTCSETPNKWKPSIEQIEQIAKFIKEPCSCCNFYDIGLDAYKDKCDGCCYDNFDMNVLRYSELLAKLEGK